jgi:hypothetical protein
VTPRTGVSLGSVRTPWEGSSCDVHTMHANVQDDDRELLR